LAKGDHDYANDMFTQCVVGDPTNLIYAQTFLGNLQRKYNNNKKGSKLAGLKGAGAKAHIKKSTSGKDWPGVIKSGCDVLKLNPWDTTALCAMANACEHLESDDCQLFYLKSALNTNMKDVEINRLSAKALTRMGDFDQAIACWHRVELARPDDQEAKNQIGNLTVEKTIHRGGYEEKAAQAGEAPKGGSSGSSSSAAPTQAAEVEPEVPAEKKLELAIARAPEEISNYIELAELHASHDLLAEAEKVLLTAQDASGGGDLTVRERLEDIQVRQARQQLDVAEHRAKQEKTEEAINLAKRMKAEFIHREIEFYAARIERSPSDASLHFELALRLKRAGKYNDAIKSFQSARSDVKRKAQIHLELGECFHHIKQYKLAMTNYQSAVEATGETASETKKNALYRAGVLATGLKELESAEKYLTELADLDFGYKDVADRLDKLATMRNDG
jgi:tetratricopeptide (TPR) repeat protein